MFSHSHYGNPKQRPQISGLCCLIKPAGRARGGSHLRGPAGIVNHGKYAELTRGCGFGFCIFAVGTIL